MKDKYLEELKEEIVHIFESGANEIRVYELVKRFVCQSVGVWQAMEGAPLDGTRVLVYMGELNDYTVYTASYRSFHPNAKGNKTWRTEPMGHKIHPNGWMPLPPNNKQKKMKTEYISGAIISVAECKDPCPHCERKIPIEEVVEKWHRSKELHIRHKCKCNRFVGVTQDYRGDLRIYELQKRTNDTSASNSRNTPRNRSFRKGTRRI